MCNYKNAGSTFGSHIKLVIITGIIFVMFLDPS